MIERTDPSDILHLPALWQRDQTPPSTEPEPDSEVERLAAADALTTAKILGHRMPEMRRIVRGRLNATACVYCGKGIEQNQDGNLTGSALTDRCPGAQANTG